MKPTPSAAASKLTEADRCALQLLYMTDGIWLEPGHGSRFVLRLGRLVDRQSAMNLVHVGLAEVHAERDWYRITTAGRFTVEKWHREGRRP